LILPFGIQNIGNTFEKISGPNLSAKPKLELSETTATTIKISIPSFTITTGPIR
jgi:hypothetical protein